MQAWGPHSGICVRVTSGQGSCADLHARGPAGRVLSTRPLHNVPIVFEVLLARPLLLGLWCCCSFQTGSLLKTSGRMMEASRLDQQDFTRVGKVETRGGGKGGDKRAGRGAWVPGSSACAPADPSSVMSVPGVLPMLRSCLSLSLLAPLSHRDMQDHAEPIMCM